MTTCIYTIKDFEAIAWTEKNINPLPDETIQLINSLTEQVGSPNYIKTPSFTNGDKNFSKKKKKNNESVNSEDWQSIRSFKKTEITKKEGIQKDIDSIRLLINKLTDKTYEKIIEKLFESLDTMLENSEYDDKSFNLIGYAIFNMATNNKFNSGIYAKLCNELKNKYEFMSSIILHNIEEFMKLFENMVFVSPEDDYDKFCETNILNEKRRSMSLFLCNLYKNEVLTLDNIVYYIHTLQSRIMDGMNDENCKVEIEELSENLYVFLTSMEFKTLSKHADWVSIYERIVCIKNTKATDNAGISHKSKFKHMDMVDKCK
tara:strand:+ start:4126 stop:5076 length:951 start_codon:yes stop_codon:yes gene_type:complete